MSDETTALQHADDAYDALLVDLRAIISAGRGRAAAAVNAEIVATYWRIGERLVRAEQGGTERAGYGEEVLERVGRILAAEHGRGFSYRSLANMRQFYLAYPNVSALRTELTWTHYRSLMRLDSAERRAFYERMAVTGRWSSRELDKQVTSMLYERVGLSHRPEELAAPLPHPNRPGAPDLARQILKDPYNFAFLDLGAEAQERELERGLIAHIEDKRDHFAAIRPTLVVKA